MSARRVLSLARAEALLLRRSPVALATALAGPALLVSAVVLSTPSGSTPDAEVAMSAVSALVVFTLLLAVYYNVVTALVARRESRVLQWLRSGEISDVEILAGAVAPAAALAWAQVLVGTVAAVAVLGMPVPRNGLLVAVALSLGALVMALLAALTTCVTRTVEAVQLTTLPVYFGMLLLSGAMVPLEAFPEPVRHLAHVLPLGAVVDLTHLGLSGRAGRPATAAATAAAPALVLLAWAGAGLFAVRRWFRWSPRH